MTPEAAPTENTVFDGAMLRSSMAEQIRDFDFRFVAHPIVCILYVIIAPITISVVAGLTLEVVLWEVFATALVAVPVIIVFRQPKKALLKGSTGVRVGTIVVLIAFSQVLARLLAPDFILNATPSNGEPGPAGPVMAFSIIAFIIQHLFVWFLLMVLVAGSLNYRGALRGQKQLVTDIRAIRAGGGAETDLAKKQRDAVGEISRRIDAIETALDEEEDEGGHVLELANAVRELRQEVVRPSLEQLNALLAAARATPQVSESVTAHLQRVPWRWQGIFFSGTVAALLIGGGSLLLLAPTAYYDWGNFIQFGLVVLAFFVSAPAALLLFLAAAISPFINPSGPGTGGWGLIALILAMGAISFLQRFNRIRQVRAYELMSVASAQLALDQVRRAQNLKVIEERVNAVLHGSVQSTLLALELGLQSGDPSVTSHSREALSHLRQAIVKLDDPSQEPSEDFERALENIISVWTGSLSITIDQSPDAADALHADPLAASAVVEVVKEGTQNAVKHSEVRDVRVFIGLEGHLIRVRVSHRSAGRPLEIRRAGLGMRYLRAITQTLRLVDDGRTTTLYAEIPCDPAAPTPVSG